MSTGTAYRDHHILKKLESFNLMFGICTLLSKYNREQNYKDNRMQVFIRVDSGPVRMAGTDEN